MVPLPSSCWCKKGNYCCNNNWPISTKQLEVHHMCTFFLVFLDSKYDTFWTIFIDPRKGHFGSALMNDKFLTGSTLYTYMWIVLFELLRSEKVVITYKCCFVCYHVSCDSQVVRMADNCSNCFFCNPFLTRIRIWSPSLVKEEIVFIFLRHHLAGVEGTLSEKNQCWNSREEQFW